MVNGIVTFGCCFWSQTLKCKWMRRRERRRRRRWLCFALTSYWNPYNKPTFAHQRIHTQPFEWALIFIYRNRIVHICAWHSCKSMMTGVNPSFLFLSVHASCLFFFLVFSFIVVSGNTMSICLYILYFGWLVHRIGLAVHLAFCLFSRHILDGTRMQVIFKFEYVADCNWSW